MSKARRRDALKLLFELFKRSKGKPNMRFDDSELRAISDDIGIAPQHYDAAETICIDNGYVKSDVGAVLTKEGIAAIARMIGQRGGTPPFTAEDIDAVLGPLPDLSGAT